MLKIEYISADEVKISVSSERQEAKLSVGEEERFELSGDNKYDVLVKLNSINYSEGLFAKADMIVQTLNEEIFPSSSDLEESNLKEENDSREEKNLEIVPLVILILIGIVLFYFYRRRKHRLNM